MAESGHHGAEVEISPADGQPRRSFRGARRRWPQSQLQPMAEIHEDQHRGGNEGHTHEAVRDSAVMLQSGDGAFEFPKHVDVGSLSGQHHCERGEGALTIEARASHARASQKMSERVQVFPRVVLGTARELLYAGASWIGCKG